MNYLSDRVNHIDSSGIRRVFDIASKMTAPINLSIGQPDFCIPDSVATGMINSIKEGYTKYTVTQGNEGLRRKILKKYYGDKYTLENIIITSGVTGGIFLSFMATLNKGDGIMIFDPYFVMYRQLASLFGADVILVDTYPDFAITRDILDKAYKSNVKVLMLNSPSNPTGVVYTEAEIKIISEFAALHNILVVSDEIYNQFVYDGEFVSISEYYDNVIILNGFSKSFAMAGERVGYAIAPQYIVEALIKLQQYTYVCAPTTAQRAIEYHLDCDFDFSNILDKYRRKRDIVYNGLHRVTDIKKSSGAFYSFVSLENRFKGSEFAELAIKNNVLVIPGNVFSQYDCAIRISFAQDDTVLERGIAILSAMLEG